MTMIRSVTCMFTAAFSIVSGSAQAEIKKEWIEYSHDGTKLKAYLAYDDSISGKRPAVFLVHRRNGMDEETLKNTEMYAKLGYAVFAVDMFGFGQGVLPKTVPEMQAQTRAFDQDRALMKARAQAGLDAMTKLPQVDASKVALLGYCFGGTVGIEEAYAGAPFAATITIHGSFRDHDASAAKNVKGPVLILHGAEDPVAPLSEVDKVINALRAAKKEFQLEVYSGTAHGFSTPKDKAEERANTQSIQSTGRFLKETFGI